MTSLYNTILSSQFILSYIMLGMIITNERHTSSPILTIVEICDNAQDDDGDGLIDLNDPDCACKIIQPISYIPNPSFEDQNCCPSDRSQLDCATSWIQASQATTDFLHTCGWMGWPEFPPPLPFPDGKGIMGFRDGRVSGQGGNWQPGWKEYAGACLLRPLRAGVTYLIEFDLGFVNDLRSPPINITFFGSTLCTNLPFGSGNDYFGCPTNGPGWKNLGSKFVSGDNENKWVNTSIILKPDVDIYAIAIGPDCNDIQTNVSLYYYFDNLILADIEDFQFKISGTDQPCAKNFSLRIPQVQGLAYQWYKEGIALLGEKSPLLSKMYGEGNYQVRVLDGLNCSLSGVYEYVKPVTTKQVAVTICKDSKLTFGNKQLITNGIYQDTFKTMLGCDSIVTLNLRVLGELKDTLNAKIFEGEEYKIANQNLKTEGSYDLKIQSIIGCDSLVLLNLSHFKVYFPNIFSPNGDNINDSFTIINKDTGIETIVFSVYDRWGNLIYTGQSWDGTNKNNPAEPNVYTYVARVTTKTQKQHQFSGTVTLVR